jgi:hypothetical protein
VHRSALFRAEQHTSPEKANEPDPSRIQIKRPFLELFLTTSILVVMMAAAAPGYVSLLEIPLLVYLLQCVLCIQLPAASSL